MDHACFFCGAALGDAEPETDARPRRLAFDPRLGRLWLVCPHCQRWNAVPIEDRWELLERCERAARDQGRLLLRTDHLSLLATRRGQLVRVGAAPRVEIADWRYSDRLDAFPVRRPGLLARLLRGLPEASPAGADLHGVPRPVPAQWISSPFLEHGGLLRALFLHVPLAPECPACARPLALAPLDFSRIRLVYDDGAAAVCAGCAWCGSMTVVALHEARPTLRAALAIVGRGLREPRHVEAAARGVDGGGGAEGFVARLAATDTRIDSLDGPGLLALRISLDEQAEAEALEAEWREAEELARIMDGELTEVPGFDEFRERVLRGGRR